MIDAAIVGLGWWGRTLVESVQGHSDDTRFVAGATDTRTVDTDRFLHTHPPLPSRDDCGPIDSVYCQSLRRAVAIEGDATTVMLFRMRSGASGYLGAIDVTRAALEAFAAAAQGGNPFPISLDDMAHGASVTEAVVRSAASGAVERVA